MTGRTERPTVLVAHPSAELYGSDRVMLESVRGFRGAGAEVVVTVPEPGPLVEELLESGARVVRSRALVLRKSLLRPSGLVALPLDAARSLRVAVALVRRFRPSVIYVSTLTLPLWSVVGRVMHVPVLVHVHEAEGSASPLLQRGLAGPVALANAVVTNSEYSRDVLGRSARSAARRGRVIYNGVPGPRDVVPPRTTVDDGPRILYIGRLSPRKGVDLIVRALPRLAERHPGIRLELVGAVFPGYEWYEQELRDLAATTGVSDRIEFAGFESAIWPRLEGCDMVVIPSRLDEPFGNTAVEAVLAARPSIVSATSGLREASRGYRSARQFKPGDVDALIGAIEATIEDWPDTSTAAIADSRLANERHDPLRYRRLIAAEALSLTPDRGARAAATTR